MTGGGEGKGANWNDLINSLMNYRKIKAMKQLPLFENEVDIYKYETLIPVSASPRIKVSP